MIDIINSFPPAFRKSPRFTRPLEWMIIHVGDATTVRKANADARAAANPMIIGSPPMLSAIGPMTATAAALLRKLVRIADSRMATVI